MSIPPPPSTPPRMPGGNDGDDERSLTGELFAVDPDAADAETSAPETAAPDAAGPDLVEPERAPDAEAPPVAPWGPPPAAEDRLPAAHQWPGDLAGEPRGAGDPPPADAGLPDRGYPDPAYPPSFGGSASGGVHDQNRQQAAQYWQGPPAVAAQGSGPAAPVPPVAYTRQKPARSRGPAAYLVIAGVAVLALIIGAVLGANLLSPKNDQAAAPPAPSVTVSPLPSSQPSDPASPPGTGAGAPPTATPTGGVAVELAKFSSPSKNISCMIDGGAVRCDIVKKTYKDPQKPADCQGDFGRSLTANTAGVNFGCVGDTVADPSLPVLDYDQTSSAQGVTCTSRKTGIRCTVDATGHGFNLASADYEIF